MEKEHELEWKEAQNIVISEDLLTVAKRQLQFLAAVDQNRWLYEGPALQKAIYRYNACWLPLLARHSEAQVSEGPLVVPLDCEWVWHCHRLNPLRYKSDCDKFYGRILDNKNVVSSLQGISKGQTEEIWNKLYPEEPYDIDLTKALSYDISESLHGAEKHTKYDLVSAVERQSRFFYQVSRPHMNDDHFLEGAVARYKGFLHLIRRNRERSLKRFCVPTYDIDLIWHSHQLNPVSYCNDLVGLLGKVVGHDDTDSDTTKGSKLNTGFCETTQQWKETFGSRYWRAGAMYRATAPSPLTITPLPSNAAIKEVNPSKGYEKIMDLPQSMMVERGGCGNKLSAMGGAWCADSGYCAANCGNELESGGCGNKLSAMGGAWCADSGYCAANCGNELESDGCGGGCGNTLKSGGVAPCVGFLCGSSAVEGNTLKTGDCYVGDCVKGNTRGPCIDEQLKQVAVQAN